MKKALRAALIACAVFTILTSWIFFSHGPVEVSLMPVQMFLASLPLSALATALAIFKEINVANTVQAFLNSQLHMPLTDQLIWVVNNAVFWVVGCVQYGGLAIWWSLRKQKKQKISQPKDAV